jgi:D-glucosaminate-6-phosphate ammonia-lyase
VDIGELQAAASRVISKLTGAEAGIVTTGAAAALTLAAAAAMTRWDIARMAALPQTDGFPNEILLPRTHYTQYAHALRASGARLVDIGHNDRGTGAGVRGLEPWEIETAITPRTAAFAFAANPSNTDDLVTVVEICRARNIPVIVDAAAQLPPKANLRKFVQCGADLVAFSGGKAIGGAGEPPVHLSERFAAQGILIIDPQALRPEDDAALAAAVRAALSDAGR